MVTAELNTTTHDITWGGLSGDEAIRQTVDCELRVVLGEWFLDRDKGIPWIPQANATATPIMGIFPADLSYAEALIKAAILRVDGVAALAEFVFTAFDHVTRTLLFWVRIVTVTGSTFTLGNQP